MYLSEDITSIDLSLEQKPEEEQKAEAEKKPEAKPTYTYTDLNKTMYAKSSVNVRELPSTKGKKLGALSKAQEVLVTGQCNETGWYRINFDGVAAYVSNNYLIEELPEIPEKDEGQDYEDNDYRVKNTPYTNVLYTEEDCLGDGFDEYRVGLHRYTDDGKWELYVLKNWEFPDGNTYYGYFISNMDAEYSEAEINFEGNWVLSSTPKYNDFDRAVFYMEDRYFLSISSGRVDFLPRYFEVKDMNPSIVHWADHPIIAYEFVELSYYIPESEYTEKMYIHDYYEIKALFHYSFIAAYSDGFTNEEGFYYGLEAEKVTYEEFLKYEKIAEKYNYDDYARDVYKPEQVN